MVFPDFQPMRVSKEPVCIYLFRQNPVFTSLHFISPVHVVPPQEKRWFTHTKNSILILLSDKNPSFCWQNYSNRQKIGSPWPPQLQRWPPKRPPDTVKHSSAADINIHPLKKTFFSKLDFFHHILLLLLHIQKTPPFLGPKRCNRFFKINHEISPF